jgi:hypothetical protein
MLILSTGFTQLYHIKLTKHITRQMFLHSPARKTTYHTAGRDICNGIVNLSHTSFDKEELSVLKLGWNYTLEKPIKSHINRLIFEKVLQNA